MTHSAERRAQSVNFEEQGARTFRISDFGFQNAKSASDTGNPPEGWESE
jgi:hypothetical protein